jgi:hypothetical protein
MTVQQLRRRNHVSGEINALKKIRELLRIGLPSVIVVLLWVGLWFYWPQRSISAEVKRVPFQSRMRIVYMPSEAEYHMPDIFARMPVKGAWQAANYANGPDLGLVLSEAVPPRYLESSSPIFTNDLPDIMSGSTNGIWFGRTSWDSMQTFAGSSGTVHSVIIELGSALESAKFSFSVPATEAIPAAGRLWELLFSVDLNDLGMVEHLFMEKSSGVPDIDRIFSDMIMRGRAEKISDGIRGSIRIRPGIQPVTAAEVLK